MHKRVRNIKAQHFICALGRVYNNEFWSKTKTHCNYELASTFLSRISLIALLRVALGKAPVAC